MGIEAYNFSQKQSDAWHHLQDPDISEVFLGGGAGLGKSEFGCSWMISNAVGYPGSRGLIAREEYVQLRDSTLQTFLGMLDRFGYVEGLHYDYHGGEHTFQWMNGSSTMFRHLVWQPRDPYFQRFGSTEFSFAFIDEAPEVMAKAADIIGSRIRYKVTEFGITPKLLLTGNPGDHWIKYRFVKDADNVPVKLLPHRACVLGTLLDNPNREFVEVYRTQLERLNDEYDRQRLLYGDWDASPRTGMEFFPAFDSRTHIDKDREYKYDPNKPLHITFDFNSKPYITLLIAQVVPDGRRYGVHFLKEYCLPYPQSRTITVCDAFAADLTSGMFAGHRGGLYYYGDYSGQSNTTMAIGDIRHNYDVARQQLGRWMHNNSNRLMPNPPHVKVRDFMTHVMKGELPVYVMFDPEMHNTLKDMRNMKQGPDGGILKVQVHDRETGMRYEQYGHCGQAMYYLVCGCFRDVFMDFNKYVAAHYAQQKLQVA